MVRDHNYVYNAANNRRYAELAGGQQLKPSAAKLATIHSQSYWQLKRQHCLSYIGTQNYK